LSISVGRVNYVPIDDGHFTDSASGDEFRGVGAHTTQPHDQHVCGGQLSKGCFANEQLRP
jgi:hypothetical protein